MAELGEEDVAALANVIEGKECFDFVAADGGDDADSTFVRGSGPAGGDAATGAIGDDLDADRRFAGSSWEGQADAGLCGCYP